MSKQVRLTPGMYRAYDRRLDPERLHHTCRSCGLRVPRYPGRYPRRCPSCGLDLMAPVDVEAVVEALVEGRMTAATAVGVLLRTEAMLGDEDKRETPLGRDLDDFMLHINGLRVLPQYAGADLSVDNSVIVLYFYPDVSQSVLDTLSQYAKTRGFDVQAAQTGGEEKTGWALTLTKTSNVPQAVEPMGLVDIEVPMAGDAEPGVI